MSTNGSDIDTLRLVARVLTLHFQEGQSQAQIAKSLRLSTAKVNRLIKQGREQGMVEFIVHSPFQRLFELERRLRERWPNTECQVIDAVTGNPETTLDLVGKAAASYLRSLIENESVLAISGGKAVSAIADNLEERSAYACTVVPLTGGVQGQHYTDVNHLATRIADGLGGVAKLIHAPLHADSQEERDLLMSVKSVHGVMSCARSADVAIFGIGSVAGEGATYFAAQPLSEKQREELYQDGVRAEFVGYLIDHNGRLCDSELNSKLVSLDLAQTQQIPSRIGIASGEDKVEPICAVLNGGHVNALILDDGTAQKVLKLSDEEIAQNAKDYP